MLSFKNPTFSSSLSVGLIALVIPFAVGCTALLGGSADDGNCTTCGDGDSGPGGPGTDPIVDPDGNPIGVLGVGWTTRYPRLSHEQWDNTVRDLLKLPSSPTQADSFSLDPDDSLFGNYAVRTISGNLWLDYLRATEEVVAQVVSNTALLDGILTSTDPAVFVADFGRRAFRRPLSNEEVTTYVGLFNSAPTMYEGGDSFQNGAELVLRAMLQSPYFLYRVESSTTVEKTADGDRIWLSGYEMASRLSYALWNTMPSDALLDAAGAGELDTAEGVKTWALQMLSDPKATEMIVSFHEQMFHVENFGSIAKNETLFPTFNMGLAPVLQEEASLFFREVAGENDGGIAPIMTSPVTYVNSTTAPFYGVTGAFGESLSRVELDPTQRAGILTHIGFLSRYGSQSQSDPILRGVHISLDYLCSDLPPPPNNIPQLPPLSEGQTNRERVEDSTSVQPCASCHETAINPLGFAFEHYDAIGQWRATDNGAAVNAADSYVVDGAEVSYSNAVELAGVLADSNDLHSCYSQKWLEFLMARAPSEVEEGVIQTMTQSSLDSSSLRNFIASVTALDTFRARPPEVSP